MTQSKFVDESVKGWSRLLPRERDRIGFEVVQRLTWSGRLANRLMERAATIAGFQRRGDYEVLSLLRRNEPARLTPIEVAQQLLASQSGLTGKLDRLEDQGLIQRLPDPDDRRAVRLQVTDDGRALIDVAFTSSLTVYDSMLEGLSREELESLGSILHKLLARLDHLQVEAAKDAGT